LEGFFMPEFEQDAEIIFTWWFERGFELLPCQPGTKYLVTGFGVNQKHISTLEDARAWFVDRRANMALISPPGALLLDFDDKDLYLTWAKSWDIVTRTYTERTPHGGARVVLWGDISPFSKWRDGVELKRNALVAPSIVDGLHYLRPKVCNEIQRVDNLALFSALCSPGYKTPYALAADDQRERRNPEHISGVIDRIKSDISILVLLQEHAPKTFDSLRGRGRFLSGLCPLHHDRTPSFYIDSQLNRWGCHGCKKSGDVIDLYAELVGVDTRDAIRHLSRRVK
jgi:hypothetical protein